MWKKLIFCLFFALFHIIWSNTYIPADESRMEEIDGPGTVHVSQHEGSNEDYKYTIDTSETWVTSIVDNTSGFEYTSMALDARGKAHISYKDDHSETLKYATNASGK